MPEPPPDFLEDDDASEGADSGRRSSEASGAFASLFSPVRDFADRSREHLADYLRARGELLEIEAAEAAAAAKEIALASSLGIGLVLPGYTLCLVAALRWLSGEWDVSRFGMLALVTGLVHVAIGSGLLLHARKKARATRFLEESREQLKRDKEWLQQLRTPPTTPTPAPENRA